MDHRRFSRGGAATWLLFLISLIGVLLVVWLLTDIFEKKQEARYSYIKTQELAWGEPDPDKWKANFPREYAAYMKTMKTSELAETSPYARYGGSEAVSKLDKDPRMKRLFAGYGFGVDYNEDRGHMNAVPDMLAIKRLGDKKPGSCMTCKSPQVPLFMEKNGAATFYKTPVKELVETHGFKYSISCGDCHNAETMELLVRRPAYIEAQNRRGIDIAAHDQNSKRTDACAQCHVEYYWPKETNYLTFPWDKGLSIDSIEAYYDSIDFYDWVHAESGAKLVKMQHPEYELWSSGVHSRSGVGCADCHMPYTRDGSIKITDHWIRSPYMNMTNACLTCHRESEDEMAQRIREIQDRTWHLMDRSEAAIIAAIDAIVAAKNAGATDEELEEARKFHRKAHIRWDFVSAENSMGFHSPQESTRMLGDAIDYARQGELSATKLLAKHGKLEVAALTQ
ncbi:MAG: ammonia-forming cytochrome c nitrite reductase subunit c552 [Calditrichaeota bacterium]|nr:ammonia-forming cytochrome c nitrite reductase subunit c552 [Calditrichota bacterium]